MYVSHECWRNCDREIGDFGRRMDLEATLRVTAAWMAYVPLDLGRRLCFLVCQFVSCRSVGRAVVVRARACLESV